MDRSDLKADRIEAWRNLLPEDILEHIPADLGAATEESIDALADDLATASARRIPEIIVKHGATLATAGRARRVRVLAWAIPRVWKNATELTRTITDEDGEAGSSSSGKVAGIFKEDFIAMSIVARSRIVRAAVSKQTVDAVAGGVREFDQVHNIQHGGAF